MSFTTSSSEDLEAGTTWFSPEEEHLEIFCRNVPKVELHVHLDGSFDPDDLWAYLQSNPELIHCFPVEKKLPWDTSDASSQTRIRERVAHCQSSLDYRRLCTCRRRYRKLRHDNLKQTRQISPQKVKGSLEEMLLCFEFFTPLVYDNFLLLEYLARDFVRRQSEQNVIYTEVRYSPQLLASEARLAHKAITKGLRQGCKDHPHLFVNQILCGINFCPVWAREVLDMATEFRKDFPCAVVGIDIAAGEDHFRPDSPFHDAHLDMCRQAVERGIPITLHSGEVPDSKQNISKAILEYGARRIGHGYSVVGDEETLNLVKHRNVHFEACLTSSVETGGWIKTDWKDHPAAILRRNEVKVSINSDDPAVFNTSLTWQWRIALKKMGWRQSDILKVLNDSIEASFAPESQKKTVRNHIHNILSNSDEINAAMLNQDFSDRVHYD